MTQRVEGEDKTAPMTVGRREVLKGALIAGAALAAPTIFVRRASAQEQVKRGAYRHGRSPLPIAARR